MQVKPVDVRRYLGSEPRLAPLLLVPPGAVVVFDRLVRGRILLTSSGIHYTGYAIGLAIGTLGWLVVVWVIARFLGAGRRRAAAVFVGAVVVPLAVCAFPVQVAYYRYAHVYSSRNTLAIAWKLRETVQTAVLGSWQSMLPGLVFGLFFVSLLVFIGRRLAESLKATEPLVPLCAGTVMVCLALGDRSWADGLFALPPDASAVASLVGSVAMPREPRGLTVRSPLPLPRFAEEAAAAGRTPLRRDVVLIISESIRADLVASTRDTARPSVLDEIIPDRIGLSRMTSQSSGTFISCVSTWTGLPPDIDVRTAHQAPLVFELAKAAGYRTLYVGAQRGDSGRLGTYLRDAGLDVHLVGEEIDPDPHAEIGARDDAATRHAIHELGRSEGPTFLVLHLSATHYPYRVDETLSPHQPTTTVIAEANGPALKNRYRNAVLLQERILRDFFRDLAALPARQHAVTFFVSDHGEAFYEHGAFSHIRTLYEEELRVPAFFVARPGVLSEAERAALEGHRAERVYNQDVTATMIDLFGLWDERPRIPLAARRTGRSLLRPRPTEEPVVLLANRNGVWDIDQPAFGAMQGERKVLGRDTEPFVCYDLQADPGEREPRRPGLCGPAHEAARRAYPFVPK